MLRLADLHLLRTILTAIALASFCLFLGIKLDVINVTHMSINTMSMAVPIGGAIFGLGWSLSGYCPGTAVVAFGSGRKDALAFILGGLCGAAIYMVSYQYLAETTLFNKMYGGKVTLAANSIYPSLINNFDSITVVGITSGFMLLLAFLLRKL